MSELFYFHEVTRLRDGHQLTEAELHPRSNALDALNGMPIQRWRESAVALLPAGALSSPRQTVQPAPKSRVLTWLEEDFRRDIWDADLPGEKLVIRWQALKEAQARVYWDPQVSAYVIVCKPAADVRQTWEALIHESRHVVLGHVPLARPAYVRSDGSIDETALIENAASKQPASFTVGWEAEAERATDARMAQFGN